MNDVNRGLSGSNYDRQVERYDESTLSRMQLQYWEARQTFIRKLRRKEDDCIVASDAELDSKLELFKAIEETCTNLLCILEGYQDRLCTLAHEESAVGRFLKEAGKMDKTRAGKMMAASGKTLNYTAQQRIQLRVPLVRLYQEVETFQYRAITDTYSTIDKMEKARTAYRGALLWMKDISQNLDPDTYKQLEKFRKVQSHVRRTKARFDKVKLDTLQKIDMLSASRCNLFSHSLATYQQAWLTFWEKSSRTMNAVAESFTGYQYYEFNMLKELTETSKRLAGESQPPIDDANFQNLFGEDDKDKLLFFDAEYRDDIGEDKLFESNGRIKTKGEGEPKNDPPNGDSAGNSQLLDIDGMSTAPRSSHDKRAGEEGKVKLQDLLSSFEPDEINLMNELFDISESAQAATSSTTPSQSLVPGPLPTKSMSNYLPSHLLEKAFSNLNLNKMNSSRQAEPEGQAKSKSKPNEGAEWLNLFAELDPLANPDSIGNKTENDDRNC